MEVNLLECLSGRHCWPQAHLPLRGWEGDAILTLDYLSTVLRFPLKAGLSSRFPAAPVYFMMKCTGAEF
jgi:hypothetical protein